MTPLDRFEAQRQRLLALAYRMLGSAAEAEDAVQDSWIRWQSADHAAITNDRGWLVTAVVRLCLDKLKSAHSRRISYPGPWLPEPVVTEAPLDLETISLGFLVLLEQLNPVERAVFLLHEVFDHGHREIAEMLATSEAASRQSLRRARQHLAEGRPRFAASRERHQQLLGAFVLALSRGDVEALASVLAEDATLYADGGGKVRGAATRPVHGSQPIARFLAGLLTRVGLPADLAIEIRDVNGWPAVIGRGGDRAGFVITIESDGERITAIRNVVNPDKLTLPRIE